MKDRLLKIITSEGLTPSQLADEIGVQRSGISHILSERNYPSFDFLQKLLTRFPKLNAEWLILERGSMYKSISVELPDLFAPERKTPVSPTLPENGKPLSEVKLETQNPKPEILPSEEGSQADTPKIQPEILHPAETKKTIDKIIILYTDKTFSSYLPE